jgi:hypothetical protein
MSNRSEQTSAFKKFLQENKSLTFMLPVLAILIVVLIIVYSGGGKDNAAAPASSEITEPSTVVPDDSSLVSQPQVDVLPQIIRSATDGAVEVIKDPFETPIKLTGIIHSSMRSTAIIESNGISYIVKEEDFLGDSTWSVSLIEKDSVTLVSGDKTMTLTLD